MSRFLKLEQVCHKITDGSHNPPKGVELSEYIMLSSKNILDGEITFEKPRFLKHEDFLAENKRTNIEIGDVLLTIVGTIGRCAVVDEIKQAFTLQRSVAVLKPDKEIILPKYLMFALQNMTAKFEGSARGVAQKGIYLKSLKQFEVFVPSLAEQQRIVAKLDAAFDEIGNAKHSLEQEKVHYRHFVRAVVLSKLEGIDKRYTRDFEQVCDFVRGPFGGSLKKSMFVDKGFAVYEQQHPINDQFDDFRYFITEEKFTEMERFAVQPGDVLMSCSGSLGKTGIVPTHAPKGVINQALLKITPKENILAEYLQLVMRSDLFQSLIWNVSGGAAQANVPPIKVIKKLPLPVPPIAEQEIILNWAQQLMDAKLEEILDNKLLAFAQLKSAILSKELQSEAA